MSRADSEVRFARLVVEQGFATQAHVDECLEIIQGLDKLGITPLPKLRDVLAEKGYISEEDRNRTLSDPYRTKSTKVFQFLSEDPEADGEMMGKYRIIERIGEGGMGEVWKAVDPELGREVAIKIMKGGSADERARFRREAQTAARIHHPNIAAVYEAGDGYIAMQYIDGQTLESFPRDDRKKLAMFVRFAALAVHHAHESDVVHRDIKPHNLMVDRKERLFVMDFGLAKETSVDTSISVSGAVLGTPAFMPPEQARGDLDAIDARSDVYSLGATLYSILTDRPPFEGGTSLDVLRKVEEQEPLPVRQLNPNIDRDLQTITMKCLEKDPVRRYASAKDLADDLKRYLDGEAIVAHPPSVFYVLRKRLAKRKAVVAVAVAGLILASGLLAWLTPRWLEERRMKEERQARLQALSAARPHLDEGRRILHALDRLMVSERWTAAEAGVMAGEARGEFRKALELCEDHPEAYLEIARTHGLLSEWEKSLSFADRAIETSEGHGAAHLERALIRLNLYRRERHPDGGDAVPETTKAKNLRAEVEGDLSSVAAYSHEEKEIILARAMSEFIAGRYVEAAARFEDYSNLTRSDATGWWWAAHALRHADADAWKIAELTRRALEFRPRDADLWYLLGKVMAEVGDVAKARNALSKAIDLRPGWTLPSKVRARLRLTKTSDAVEDYDRVVRLSPEDPSAWFERGLFQLKKNKLEKAVADFQKTIELNKRHIGAYYNLARCRIRQDRFEEAIQACDRVIELQSDHASVFYERAYAKWKRNDFDGAYDDLTRQIEIAPDQAGSYKLRGLILDARKDWTAAIRDLDVAVRLEPKNGDYWNIRGIMKSKSGQPAEAKKDYDRAIELDPEDFRSRYNRGVAHRVLGDLDAAEKDFDATLKLNNEHASALFQLGLILQERKQWKEASAKFMHCKTLRPKFAPAPYEMAHCFIKMSRYGAALIAFDEAVRLDPGNPDYRLERARIRFLRQDPRGAEEDLITALKIATADWEHRERVKAMLEDLRRKK